MMTEALAENLTHCRSVDEFYELCAPLGLYGSGRRFMHLELDIVNRCNIRCVMCYHSLESTRRAKPVYLSPEDFSLSASRVLPHAHRLSLSIGNEPLMSPHFVEILRVAAGYEVPHVNFFTNGLLLTDTNIDAIIECGVTQVCVSIDGATPATYNSIRRGGDFHQVVRNVERLVARRNGAGSATPHARFDMVMMQRNVHEMVDLVMLAARLGIQELNFRHLVSFEGLGMETESLTHTKALSNYWLDRALAMAAKLGLVVQTQPARFDLDTEDAAPVAAAATPFLPTPYCPFPFFHVTMGPGGHVLACPFSHGEAPYGQVSAETPLDQIWLGPKFATLRQRILRHDPPDMCRRCSLLAFTYPNVKQLFATRKH
jgi:MoaA/NifB/PqqE/SkfB family radical SAM enzyme